MDFLNLYFLAQTTPTPEELVAVQEGIAELRNLIDNEMGIRGTVTLLLLISLSISVGRSYILLANRITPVRLILSMVVGILVFAFSLFIWTTTVYWIGRLYYDVAFNLNYWEINALVILAFVPLTQAWLGLIPYLGSCFVRLQYTFSVMLLFIFMLVIGFGARQALIAILLGALILLVAQRTVLFPLIALQNRIAGTHLRNRYRNVIRDSRLELK